MNTFYFLNTPTKRQSLPNIPQMSCVLLGCTSCSNHPERSWSPYSRWNNKHCSHIPGILFSTSIITFS